MRNTRRASYLLLLPLVLLAASALPAQDLQPPAPNVTVSAQQSDFRVAVIKASRSLMQQGKLTRVQVLRIRVAMLSPAFRNHAEELAVVQIYYSGDDQTETYLPLDSDGKVDKGQIDWEGLINFLEKFIPLLLQLLEIFGAT